MVRDAGEAGTALLRGGGQDGSMSLEHESYPTKYGSAIFTRSRHNWLLISNIFEYTLPHLIVKLLDISLI